MALTLLPASNFSLASFWFASASKYVCKPAWQWRYDFPNYWSGKHTQHSNKTASCETKSRPLNDLQGLIGFFWPWNSTFLGWEHISPKPIAGPSIDGRKAFESKLHMDFGMILRRNKHRARRFATLSSRLCHEISHICQQSQDFPTSTQPKGDFDVNDSEESSRSLTASTPPKGAQEKVDFWHATWLKSRCDLWEAPTSESKSWAMLNSPDMPMTCSWQHGRMILRDLGWW